MSSIEKQCALQHYFLISICNMFVIVEDPEDLKNYFKGKVHVRTYVRVVFHLPPEVLLQHFARLTWKGLSFGFEEKNKK